MEREMNHKEGQRDGEQSQDEDNHRPVFRNSDSDSSPLTLLPDRHPLEQGENPPRNPDALLYFPGVGVQQYPRGRGL